MIRSNVPQEPLALWASRLSLFALALILVGLLLHRVGALATPVAITAVVVAYVCAALSILIAIVAGISIWTRGRLGSGRVAIGLIGGGLLWGGALAAVPTFLSLPPINDVSTDLSDPPRFIALAKDRPSGAKPHAYPGERFARQQQTAYPDLRTLVVDRSVEDLFEHARLTAEGRKGLGWRVVTRELPQLRPSRPGIIEATPRTTLVGFTDDVIIRVTGTETEARLDIRSASRFGQHDFGTNASRVRRFIRELQSRLDASTPGSVIRRRPIDPKQPLPAGAKRQVEKAGDPKNAKGGSGSDTKRAPQQKSEPRG